MATVRLSQAALDDFDRVIDQLGDVSTRAVAARYAEQLRAKINLLAEFPGAGTPRTAFGDATRVASVEPYLIFYDGGPQSEVVHVLRILHGHRDITPEMIARGRRP